MNQQRLGLADMSKVKVPRVTIGVLIRDGRIVVTDGESEISLTTAQAEALRKELGGKIAKSKRIYRRGRRRRMLTARTR